MLVVTASVTVKVQDLYVSKFSCRQGARYRILRHAEALAKTVDSSGLPMLATEAYICASGQVFGALKLALRMCRC